MPRGTRRAIPGHALVRQDNGMARCECGWSPINPATVAASRGQRGKHLRQVRLDLAASTIGAVRLHG